MKLVVVSGRSGSGKSSALHVLEDLGFYCVDNLPVALLPQLTLTLEHSSNRIDRVAVGIDARNVPENLLQVSTILRDIRNTGVNVEVVYLDARDDILLQRFHSTRRKHPLSGPGQSLHEAIASEARLLDPINLNATIRLDTSSFNIHQLREEFRNRIELIDTGSMALLFESFAYKQGVPVDADFVFDVRCLPNPHWIPELRELTGLDEPVAGYLSQQSLVQDFLGDLQNFLESWIRHCDSGDRSYLTVAFGCTGGQHRSVFICEQMAEHFRLLGYHLIQVRHRELSLS